MTKFNFDEKYFMIKQSKNRWCPPRMSGPLDFYKRYLLYVKRESNIIGFSIGSNYLLADFILNKTCTSEASVYDDGYKPGQYL